MYTVLAESPGISRASQKVEGGPGIGVWKEEKKSSTLTFTGGREHPLLWGLREVVKEVVAFAKMAFEDGEGSEKQIRRGVARAGTQEEGTARAKAQGWDSGGLTQGQTFALAET